MVGDYIMYPRITLVIYLLDKAIHEWCRLHVDMDIVSGSF